MKVILRKKSPQTLSSLSKQVHLGNSRQYNSAYTIIACMRAVVKFPELFLGEQEQVHLRSGSPSSAALTPCPPNATEHPTRAHAIKTIAKGNRQQRERLYTSIVTMINGAMDHAVQGEILLGWPSSFTLKIVAGKKDPTRIDFYLIDWNGVMFRSRKMLREAIFRGV